MSAFYNIEVLNKNDNCTNLKVTIISPEQPVFFSTKSFALLILLDPFYINPDLKSGILSLIPTSEILDFNLDFFKKQQHNIIRSTDLKDLKNYPLQQDFISMTPEELSNFWKHKEDLPNAVLTICTVSASMLDHIKTGQSWESGAFDL